MESNGKTVNRFGEPVDYPTGPVIFGEPGTNGQHSFYQLLHQGSDIVPLQFIGFRNSQLGVDVDIENSTSQQKLCANVAAQIVAFACGKKDDNLNKNFKGHRPSSIITGDELTPASLGALLAHFENKIMFQGFVWNLNSFDQEGVQLGKVLAKRVLAHNTDGVLVFGLNSGAYISEMMRAGILSVDGGQMEAGRAMGLSFATTMRKIVIPQAVKNILPTLGNEFIALIKETSVVSFVGAADLYVAFNYIGSNSYEFMVPYLVMAVIYIALVLLISLGIKCMERSLRKSDRRN